MNVSEAHRIRRLLAFYNAVPNLVWSVLHLVPVTLFTIRYIELKWVLVYTCLSLIPIFCPNLFFDKLQFWGTADAYKRLGVDVVNKLAQNGAIINGLIRKKYPRYQAVKYTRASIKKWIGQTYMYEKFHWTMFVFFTLVIIFAIYHHYLNWALLIIINNICYNIYPNLLQQYIRLRLSANTK